MKKLVKSLLRHAIESRGYKIVHADEEVVKRHTAPSYSESLPLPPGAAEYLRRDNPRLLELKQRYSALKLPMNVHTYWSDSRLQNALQLGYFRGDNVYVWQLRNVRDSARMRYFLFTQYIANHDPAGLLRKLGEDGQFGAYTFQYQGYPLASRDLLDSVNELNFLHRHTGLLDMKPLRILDIGAGYGRMAHRTLAAAPGVTQYDCVDAIPESTFLCEYYLHHYGLEAKARSIPLDELEAKVSSSQYDLAMNIHSFSEMSYTAIEGWFALLAWVKPRYLLIVPNVGEALLSSEADKTRRDSSPLIAAAGYKLKVSEHVFQDLNLREFLNIDDYLMLYERT